MLDESGRALPHSWVAGDDEMGRPSGFRRQITRSGRALSAGRALEHAGPRPRRPAAGILGTRTPSQEPLPAPGPLAGGLAGGGLDRIEVRDGEKGPLVVEVVKRRVQARTETGGTGPDELLFVTREAQSDGKFKHDYYLSNADPEEPLKELARVSRAAHRVEECFRRGKSEAGLADYQVRNWRGWHHHQTLSLLAAWFLNREARRGKNPDPGVDGAAVAAVAGGVDRRPPQGERGLVVVSSKHTLVASQRASQAVSPSLT